MAVVIPFPRTRDRDFAKRIARRMSELPPPTAEKHLANQLRVQVETMQRRGIAHDMIEEQRRQIEAAVRQEQISLFLEGWRA